ncbi:hypothetical protein [Actibacterium sp. D379-3]
MFDGGGQGDRPGYALQLQNETCGAVVRTGGIGAGGQSARRRTGNVPIFGIGWFFWGEMVDLTVEESNRLFEILQNWESQLSRFDLNDLRCDNDNIAP